MSGKETLHMNGKTHPCEYCRLPTTQEYYVLAPSLQNPARELKYYLCVFCARGLEDSGVQIKKVKEEIEKESV